MAVVARADLEALLREHLAPSSLNSTALDRANGWFAGSRG